jgi:hypothetical protein
MPHATALHRAYGKLYQQQNEIRKLIPQNFCTLAAPSLSQYLKTQIKMHENFCIYRLCRVVLKRLMFTPYIKATAIMNLNCFMNVNRTTAAK